MDDIKNILNQINEKQDKHSEAIEALKESVIRQEVTLESHMEQDREMASQIYAINDKLGEYNAQLQIHIAGVQQLKEMNILIREELKQREKELILKLETTNKEMDKRLEVAEEPIKWFKTAGRYAAWLGTIGTAIGAVYALIQFLSNL